MGDSQLYASPAPVAMDTHVGMQTPSTGHLSAGVTQARVAMECWWAIHPCLNLGILRLVCYRSTAYAMLTEKRVPIPEQENEGGAGWEQGWGRTVLGLGSLSCGRIKGKGHQPRD